MYYFSLILLFASSGLSSRQGHYNTSSHIWIFNPSSKEESTSFHLVEEDSTSRKYSHEEMFLRSELNPLVDMAQETDLRT